MRHCLGLSRSEPPSAGYRNRRAPQRKVFPANHLAIRQSRNTTYRYVSGAVHGTASPSLAVQRDARHVAHGQVCGQLLQPLVRRARLVAGAHDVQVAKLVQLAQVGLAGAPEVAEGGREAAAGSMEGYRE